MEKALTYFYNIGPIQAKKLSKKLIDLKLINVNKKNNYSLSELKKILSKKEIFDELPEATKVDLLYNPLRKIPRPIIELINNELHKILDKYKIKFDIGGSYIRGKKSSSDIDMVLLAEDSIWGDFMNLINNNSQCIKFHEPFAKGPDKIATLIEVDLIKSKLFKKYPEFKKICNDKKCKVNVKIDIFLTTSEDYIFALLFAIGSGLFNVRMRALAKRKGYLLNHHGLWKKISDDILEKVPIKTEKELFDILGMSYKNPEERNT